MRSGCRRFHRNAECAPALPQIYLQVVSMHIHRSGRFDMSASGWWAQAWAGNSAAVAHSAIQDRVKNTAAVGELLRLFCLCGLYGSGIHAHKRLKCWFSHGSDIRWYSRCDLLLLRSHAPVQIHEAIMSQTPKRGVKKNHPTGLFQILSYVLSGAEGHEP